MVARLILVAILLTGCQTPKAGFCAVSSPIRLTEELVDKLSDSEAKQVLAHNRKGEALCNWSP